MSHKVVIIDYKLGNLFSVANACKKVGLDPVISSDRATLQSAEAAILPGVGAFGDALENLTQLELVDPIKSFVASGKPLMGVCLGMHLLFTSSDEFGTHSGLDLIPGSIRRFPTEVDGRGIKVPQIGWNTIQCPDGVSWKGSPLDGIPSGEFMYFVHSYYVLPDSRSDVFTTTNYDGVEYCSSVRRDNIFATQYHPEKSAEKGLMIYQQWKDSIFK